MDKVSKNRKTALAAERSAEQAHKAAEAAQADQSTVGKAISTANTALEVHAKVMGAYGKVMGATGALAEKAVVAVFSKLASMQGIACLPASSQLDPVMGIDVHLVMIPPSPSPVPMPHPYIAMVFNPKDFIACAVMSAVASIPPPPADSAGAQLASTVGKMALGMVMSKLGLGASIKLGGFTPRTVTGTSNKVIPHFPMGASFAPIPVLKNAGHAQFGSLFLLADGEPFTGLMHLNNDCWDMGIMQLMRKKAPAEPMHLFLPTGFVMAIPSHNVIVNPIPTPINPIAALTKLFNFGIAKILHKIISKLPGGRIANALHKAVCHVTGHPVDIASGMLFTDEEDFSLPGVIPFLWERTWYSDSIYEGPLGHGWYHSYDLGFSMGENNTGVLRMNDGRLVVFELPLPGKSTYDRAEKFFLHRHAREPFYYVTDQDGLIYRFTDSTYKNAVSQGDEHFLQSVSNTSGYAIRFAYNGAGQLVKITDSAGRQLTVNNDAQGHITSILAPHPDSRDKTFAIASYVYDEAGNMICHTDALGQQMKYEYRNRLLVKETWRNGMNWFFEYDGNRPGARCIHTWGDGDLYNHKLTYLPGITKVENSLGHFTTYHLKGGLISSRIDGNGAEWQYRYNQYNELEWETDPLGNQCSYTHDEWGSIASTTDPCGGFTHTEYYNLRFPLLPTEAMDEAGGKWKWEYDEWGKVVERVNPLGAKTSYKYEDGLLSEVADAAGVITSYAYDHDGNLASTTTSEEGIIGTYMHDVLGNCIQITNPNGVRQKYTYDLKRNIRQIHDFDGNIIDVVYDGIGNMLHYKDKHRDIKYTYRGLWKLIRREEGEAAVNFNYDTEEQLHKVVNEQGLAYRFGLDMTGNVIEETGFDGISRGYERNAAGWVTQVRRPAGKSTKYSYDACGRVTEVSYDSGKRESYLYRSDGELLQVSSESAQVQFERNLVGDILKETVNGEWVASEYDMAGNKTRTSSFLGADIINKYSKTGTIRHIQAGGWSATFKHDKLGLETERILPGGISGSWQRDGVGRPVAQTVGYLKNNTFSSTRKKQYLWDVSDLLKQIKDEKGTTRFEHDIWNNLAKTVFANGEVQLRNPDTAGNVYKTADRKDRVYLKGGQLKKAGNWEYTYDPEGNLVEKKYPGGDVWKYDWDEGGMLIRVTRPDKEVVRFTYDAFGRRLSKWYKNTVTKFTWNGNTPLHERKEDAATGRMLSDIHVGTNGITTWIYDNDGFVPVGKIKGDKQYSIISDHIGTPCQMYTSDGDLCWSRELDSYGRSRMEHGEAGSCPFKYQGQYEDAETGLCYNRFRYYSADEGVYISQDPIALAGGHALYAYVKDPHSFLDILGLATYHRKNGQFGSKRGRPKKPSEHGNSNGSKAKNFLYAKFDKDGKFLKWGKTKDMNGRYSSTELNGGKLVPVASGKITNIKKIERELAEKSPGPDNNEPWQGSKQGQPLSPAAQAAADKAIF